MKTSNTVSDEQITRKSGRTVSRAGESPEKGFSYFAKAAANRRCSAAYHLFGRYQGIFGHQKGFVFFCIYRHKLEFNLPD